MTKGEAQTTMAGLLSLQNPVFASFMFYATIVLVKTLIMSIFTARHRIQKKVFPSVEDYAGAKNAAQKAATKDEGVERVRRAHQNDLENILPFVLIGFFYVFINPTPATAILHFRFFCGARLLHSFVYLWAVPQPARVLTFLVAMVTALSMGVQVIIFAYTAGYY